MLERAGASRAELVPLELDRLVRDVAEAHADWNVRVRLALLEPVQVAGDADALRRALENLIENALVHGPAHGLVTVTLVARDGGARLTVSDQGPGPDRAQRDRVFERFWRGPDAARRPGSGLGLSIVATIAERHGGAVHVDGSAFTLELPLG